MIVGYLKQIISKSEVVLAELGKLGSRMAWQLVARSSRPMILQITNWLSNSGHFKVLRNCILFVCCCSFASLLDMKGDCSKGCNKPELSLGDSAGQVGDSEWKLNLQLVSILDQGAGGLRVLVSDHLTGVSFELAEAAILDTI